MSSSDLVDPLGLYAAAMDTSDYAATVVPIIRVMAPSFGNLLDIGAGGGQLGHALCAPAIPWTAIEPSPLMRQRLERLRPPPDIAAAGWEEADVAPASHDLVLAATMPALFDKPEAFLARCKAWARKAVVWVVPAQEGPKGLILAGCLPREWHGEDETPGIEITLSRLPKAFHPERMTVVHWTFAAVVPAIAPIAEFLADRLLWAKDDQRRPDLRAHLTRQSKPDPAGRRLEIARKSAILTWSV